MSGTEHDEREPVRLSSAGSGADPALRAALEAGRAELPTDAQLGQLAARLAPLTGVAVAGAGAVAGAWPIVASLLAVVAIGGAVAYLAVTGESSSESEVMVDGGAESAADAEVAGAKEAGAPSPQPSPGTGEGAEADAGNAAARVREGRARVDARVPTEEAPEVDVDAELALLRAAQDALRVDPARALAIAGEHARRFGDGTLAQEREVVAIEALVALARPPEARERAARFASRWPRSAHARRLAVILGDASP